MSGYSSWSITLMSTPAPTTTTTVALTITPAALRTESGSRTKRSSRRSTTFHRPMANSLLRCRCWAESAAGRRLGGSVVEARFGQRAAAPGEARLVPVRHRRESRAEPRGVHEPAVADVDAHVSDLGRLRSRPPVPEEDDVARGESVAAHPQRARDLAAHRVGGTPDKDLRKLGRPLERLQLEIGRAPW